jgi:hypothetical protein
VKSDWLWHCDHGGYFTLDWTSLPHPILCDVFEELGLPTPPSEQEAGYQVVWDWWSRMAPHMNAVQRAQVLQVMDRFSCYDVVSVPCWPLEADAEDGTRSG